MLKRLVQNGCIVNSVTDIASRLSNIKPFSAEKTDLEEKETTVADVPEPRETKEEKEVQKNFDDERTCNACFRGTFKCFVVFEYIYDQLANLNRTSRSENGALR